MGHTENVSHKNDTDQRRTDTPQQQEQQVTLANEWWRSLSQDGLFCLYTILGTSPPFCFETKMHVVVE